MGEELAGPKTDHFQTKGNNEREEKKKRSTKSYDGQTLFGQKKGGAGEKDIYVC